MTGVTLTVTKDEVGPALRRISAALDDMTPVMDLIGAEIEASIASRFKQGEGPGGEKWPPSGRVAAHGGQTLMESGRLRDSMTRSVSRREVEVGTNVIYAAIHQFGGTIRPKKPGGKLVFANQVGETVFVDEVTIPARPFMGVDDDDVAIIAETIETYLERTARA